MTRHVLLGVLVAIVVGYRGPWFLVIAARVDGPLRRFALIRGLLRICTAVAAGLVLWNVWAAVPAVIALLLDVLVARHIRGLD